MHPTLKRPSHVQFLFTLLKLVSYFLSLYIRMYHVLYTDTDVLPSLRLALQRFEIEFFEITVIFRDTGYAKLLIANRSLYTTTIYAIDISSLSWRYHML